MTDAIIELDLHGKTVYQARVTVDAALRRAKGSVCRLRLVHGCHGGTAIRDMLALYAGDSRVKRVLPISDSVTDLVLREL